MLGKCALKMCYGWKNPQLCKQHPVELIFEERGSAYHYIQFPEPLGL